MPRKRYYGTVPRDLPENERLFLISAEASRLYLLLSSQADDFGNFDGEPGKLARILFASAPADFTEATPERVARNLAELERLGLVFSYQSREKRAYIHLRDHVPSGSTTRVNKYPPPTKSQLEQLPPEIHVEGDLFNKDAVIPASMPGSAGGQLSGNYRAIGGQQSGKNGTPEPEPETRTRTHTPNQNPNPSDSDDSASDFPAGPSSASDFGSKADVERNTAMAAFARELCGPLKIRPPATVPHKSPGKKQAQADWTDLTRNIVPEIFAAMESGIIDAHVTALKEAEKSKTARKPIAVFRRRMEGLGFFKAKAKVPA